MWGKIKIQFHLIFLKYDLINLKVKIDKEIYVNKMDDNLLLMIPRYFVETIRRSGVGNTCMMSITQEKSGTTQQKDFSI